jgi:hypothetical protein
MRRTRLGLLLSAAKSALLSEAERQESNRFVGVRADASRKSAFLLLTNFETGDYSSRRSCFHHEINIKIRNYGILVRNYQ